LFSGLFLERIPLRPEIISAFFLCWYLYILFNKKNLWGLLIIQSLWVNMHGYSILGPVLLSLFILCEFIKHKIRLPFDWNKIKYLDDRAAYKKGLIVLSIIVFLSLFSPYGINNFRYPFLAIKGFLEATSNFYHISELSSLVVSDILFTQKHILLTSLVGLYMTSLLLNIRRSDIFNMLIFGIFFSMACMANRHKGLFAVTACFCILDNFKASNLGYLKNYFRYRYLGILSIILTCFIGSFIIWHRSSKMTQLRKGYIYSEDLAYKNYMYGISGSRYPEKAASFMLKNRIKGPVFNSFNIGAYLIWRLYPSYKVFVDGRTEVYGKEFMDDFAHSINDLKRWKGLDDRYGFNAVILDYSSLDLYYYLIKELYEDRQWRLIYFGDVVCIFLKDNKINKHLASSYDISFEDIQDDIEKGHFIEDKKMSVYPEYFLNRARFFIEAMDMPGPALKNLEKTGSIDPECYEVYQLLGYTYFKMREFEKAGDAFMKSLEIDPDIAEPYLNLGSVAAEKGLYEKAYFLYKQALSLDRNNRVARDNLNRLPKGDLD